MSGRGGSAGRRGDDGEENEGGEEACGCGWVIITTAEWDEERWRLAGREARVLLGTRPASLPPGTECRRPDHATHLVPPPLIFPSSPLPTPPPPSSSPQGLSAADLTKQRILCVGAGSAGMGVVRMISKGMQVGRGGRAHTLGLPHSSILSYWCVRDLDKAYRWGGWGGRGAKSSWFLRSQDGGGGVRAGGQSASQVPHLGPTLATCGDFHSMQVHGIDEATANRNFWILDQDGLITQARWVHGAGFRV